ncbi:MAG: Ku domain protein [Myxococcaceae bacterium]|nr:Ku domain protein [Myxococcaceae bacterium]
MAARSTGSTTISFGLVSIPIKLYTATQSQSVGFNMLHAECGSRVKQQLTCPVHDRVIERDETVKGYEFSKGQYVIFSAEELAQLEAEKTNTVEIVEFVPAGTVDFVQIEKTTYLGPDKGGHKAYNLLGQAMRHTELVAVGRYNARGKSYVVVIRPYQKGLALHQLYYADEVRPFDDVEIGDDVRFSSAEQELAEKLIEQLRSPSFDATRYRDEYSDRVRKAAEQKAEGMEITTAPEQPPAQIIDLFEALKRSLETPKPRRSAASEARPASASEQNDARIKGPKKTEPETQPQKRKKRSPGTGTHG